MTLAKNDAQRLLDEIVWLKHRLQRVEYAIEPLLDAIIGGDGNGEGDSKVISPSS